jgi:hypothetical protein
MFGFFAIAPQAPAAVRDAAAAAAAAAGMNAVGGFGEPSRVVVGWSEQELMRM